MSILEIKDIPGDKSISHRVLMLSYFCENKFRVTGLLKAKDTLRTLNIVKRLGVNIQSDNEKIILKGPGSKCNINKVSFDCGNSATTARLIAGILGGINGEFLLNGDTSLRNRPMDRLKKALSPFGIGITYKDRSGYMPILIKGRHTLNNTILKQFLPSSQIKSAFLIAGLRTNESTYIEDIPTRDHTELLLNAFGANIKIDGKKITVKYTKYLKGFDLIIPKDFSSASFFILYALLKNREIIIRDINLNKARTGLLQFIKGIGGDYEILNLYVNNFNELVGDIVIKSYKRLKGGYTLQPYDVPTMIDEIPIAGIIASLCEEPVYMSGLGELSFKESNRLNLLYKNLKKLGVNIKKINNDGLVIHRRHGFKAGIHIENHNDHRLIMVFSILDRALNLNLRIDNKRYVNISFPKFFDILKAIDIG